MLKKFLKFIFIAVIIFQTKNCDDNPSIYDCNAATLTLHASIDGNFTGIKLYNACNFKQLDSLSISFGPPRFIENTKNLSTLYSVVSDQNGNNNLLVIGTNPYSIKGIVGCKGWRVSKSNLEYLFVYGDITDTLQIFNLNNLSLINEQQIGRIGLMISSSIDTIMYGIIIDDNYTGLFKYSITSLKIIKQYQLSNIAERPVDIAISSDNRYIFFTTSVFSPFLLGKFYVFDLTINQVVYISQCPPLAPICISPDNQFVYISDPAGYEYQLNPSGKLYRFNVYQSQIEEFIDWRPYNLTNGDYDGRLPTDRMTITPDNKYLYISTLGGMTEDGKSVDVIKVSINSKSLINYLSIPLDHRGYKTESIINIKLIHH